MVSIAGRLKDALWSLRTQFGLAADVDRVLSFVAFEKDLTEDELNALFIDYPVRIPEDFRAALVARIQQTIRQYWKYRRARKGYHKILKDVIFLENVARHGFEGCWLVHDKNTGFALTLKPKLK